MADPRNPKPGEVWEYNGKQREVKLVVSSGLPWADSADRVTYRIGKRNHTALRYVWVTWANKATCIKEATDERRDV